MLTSWWHPVPVARKQTRKPYSSMASALVPALTSLQDALQAVSWRKQTKTGVFKQDIRWPATLERHHGILGGGVVGPLGQRSSMSWLGC